MERSDIKRLLEELIELASAGTEQRLHQAIDARIQLINIELLERHARTMNALALADAKIAALTAFVSGHDVQEAFASSREVFRRRHEALFDPEAWLIEPDWLQSIRPA